jgi:hypothetical protein
VGEEVREIGALSTAPGFTARHDNDITLRFVKRLQHGAEVPAPVVTPDGRLAYSEVVIAAHYVNETTHCLCKVVECSKEELDLMRKLDDAKLKRRGLRSGRLVVELVTLTERDVLRSWEREGTLLDGNGIQRHVRPTAREWVAQALGMAPRAVRMVDSPGYARKKPEPEPAWDLRCHDWQPAPGLLEEARLVREALRAMDTRLRRDQRELTPLVAHATALPDGRRLYDAVHKLAAHVRGMLPEHLCPYCKSAVAIRPTCVGCKGAGWVSEDVWARAPEELRTEYLVSHGGQILDPLTMQTPRRPVREKWQSAQFVGDLYEEQEEPPEDEEDVW